MSAFVIATVAIKNPEKLQEYAQKSMATIAAFGGEPVARGKVVGIFSGDAKYEMTAVVKFPDIQAIDSWYQSADYQALIPLRNEAADVTLVKCLGM